MPADNAATVPVFGAVDFPQDGPSSGTVTRLSPSVINIATPGNYQVHFDVSVTEAGQLGLQLNGSLLTYTVVGRATGTSQITGTFLITTTVPNSTLAVINAGGFSALTITPLAGGTNQVSAHLVITKLTDGGANGANGATGPTGAAGSNGSNGADGATGPIGPTGPPGSNGATGATGATGPAGANGTNGATGPAGTNGIAGVTGPTGAAGTNGLNGATGPTGAVGPAGAAGATGVVANLAVSTVSVTNTVLSTANQFVLIVGNINVKLPASPATGQMIYFYADNNVASIDPNGQTVHQAGVDYPLPSTVRDFGTTGTHSVTIIFDGSKWYPVGQSF
jgi:hypothetical protein